MIAPMAAAIIATCVRRMTDPRDQTSDGEFVSLDLERRDLFSEYAKPAPRIVGAIMVSFALYGGALALLASANVMACILLSLCAAQVAWQFNEHNKDKLNQDKLTRHASLRLLKLATPALVTTTMILLIARGSWGPPGMATTLFSHGTGDSKSKDHEQQNIQNKYDSVSSISGYESVILWPIPDKKPVVPRLLARGSQLLVASSKPLIIPFNGIYWYLQAPSERPGPKAQVSRGNPITVGIKSENAIPLTMEAHQSLGDPIDISSFGGIRVRILNLENKPGGIALAVVLSDSSSPGMPSLYLGQMPLLTTEPNHFMIKSVAAHEELLFTIPVHPNIKEFNKITVLFLPDVEHLVVGPRIALQEFELLPR